MKTPRVLSTSVGLLGVLIGGLLVGCASGHERRPPTMSEEDFRSLYPREHLQSLSPYERENAERGMMQQEWEEQGGKTLRNQ